MKESSLVRQLVCFISSNFSRQIFLIVVSPALGEGLEVFGAGDGPPT